MTATSTVGTGDDEHRTPAARQPGGVTAAGQPGEPGHHATGTAVADRPGPAADDADDAEGLGLAFAFDHGPNGGNGGRRGELFRFPAADDTGPGPRRLLVMALCTALIGIVALAVTLRGLLVIIGGEAAGWYQPAFVAAGLFGVAFVVAAFLSIHRRRLPWLLLAGSTVPLALNIAMTLTA